MPPPSFKIRDGLPSVLTGTGKFIDPGRVVASLRIAKNAWTADFGCGHGYFTIPLAKAVGGDGKVYALDIQKSALDIVRARARLEHLLNIECIRADLDVYGGSRLDDKSLDFVMISNILFQSENKRTLMQEAYRVLRDNGHLALIEWDQEKNDLAETTATQPANAIGPPMPLRIPRNDAILLAKSTGFTPDREFEAGSHHYGILLIKG